MICFFGGLDDDDDAEEETLVHRFCEFAMRTINRDMGPVFQQYVPLFDREGAEQTHEQYAAYLEYKQALQGHLETYASEQGYTDPVQFLNDLQASIAEDKAKAAEQHQRHMSQMKAQLQQQVGEGADQLFEQLSMFYQPDTADDLMQTVLEYGEYETFSKIMRMKVN